MKTIILLLALTATALHAQLIQSVAGGNPLSVGPGTAGFEFTTGAQVLTIYTLGIFDTFGDGLKDAHTVAIWDVSAQHNVIASATVAPATAVADSSGFYWVNLASPITLAAGSSFVIGASYADVTLDLALGNVPQSGIVTGGGITLGDALLSSGIGFGFPDVNLGAADFGFFGPNAGFGPVPEPTAWTAVAGLALAAFSLYRRCA